VKRSFLLHPGTILATVVLVAAVAGSVYAANTSGAGTIGSIQIKNGSIKLADINPNARKALRGATGPAGQAGAAGSARAFGFVGADGVVDAARSKNITATKLGIGTYCVTPAAAAGVTPATAFPVATADFRGNGLTHVAQIDGSPAAGCPAGWVVRLQNFSAGSFSGADLSFSIMVP
jgi:hypothetical protein